MPGRANQMSATDAYQMAGSRFALPLKVLTNKKALDMAMHEHVRAMQLQAQKDSGDLAKTKMAGDYALKQQQLRNQGMMDRTGASGAGSDSKLAALASKQATEMMKQSGIMENDPEYQNHWMKAYDLVYGKLSGQQLPQPTMDPQMMASGGDAGPSVSSMPEAISSGMNLGDVGQPGAGKQLDLATAQKLVDRVGGDRMKARALAKKLGYSF